MQNITILYVGKSHSMWEELATEYIKRMNRSYSITCIASKDAPSALPIEQRKEHETKRISSALTPASLVIELHPEGKLYTSHEFARCMQSWTENRTKVPTFLIAGTFGFSREYLPKERHILSLGKMTFTHDMTRTILLEQIYRAYTILHSIPYHH